MTPRIFLRRHRDDVLLLLVLAAAVLTALADLLGWFRDGALFSR